MSQVWRGLNDVRSCWLRFSEDQWESDESCEICNEIVQLLLEFYLILSDCMEVWNLKSVSRLVG